MHILTTSSNTRFHYNSDYSGEVTICDAEGRAILVPVYDIETFIAQKLKDELLSRIEGENDIESLSRMISICRGVE